MTLIEDARRLEEASFRNEHGDCVMCETGAEDCCQRHAHDCPTRSLPRIVAVLEAAEVVKRAYEQETAVTGLHLLGSPLLAAVDALDRAMQGEGVPA